MHNVNYRNSDQTSTDEKEIKKILFLLDHFCISFDHELPATCDGLPRSYLKCWDVFDEFFR